GVTGATKAVAEGCIEAAIGVQPRDAAPARPVDRSEDSPDQDAAVGLQSHRIDVVVRPREAVAEGRIEAALGVQPCDAIPARSVDGGEGASDQDATVRLEDEGVDGIVGPGEAVAEGRIKAAVGAQSCDAVPARSVDGGEDAPDQNSAVGLHSYGIDG